MTATLTDLRNGRDTAYEAKMMHPVPPATVVDREAFILDLVRGKVVLDIGASGAMHTAIMCASEFCYGIEHPESPSVSDVLSGEHIEFIDLDDIARALPKFNDVRVIVCGEVIEHLSNPGHFLARLRAAYRGVPVIITVPNAYSSAGYRWMERGIENVNSDHVAWYSPMTLKTLLGRAGYSIREMHFYNGRPYFAEGIIVVAE